MRRGVGGARKTVGGGAENDIWAPLNEVLDTLAGCWMAQTR